MQDLRKLRHVNIAPGKDKTGSLACILSPFLRQCGKRRGPSALCYVVRIGVEVAYGLSDFIFRNCNDPSGSLANDLNRLLLRFAARHTIGKCPRGLR